MGKRGLRLHRGSSSDTGRVGGYRSSRVGSGVDEDTVDEVNDTVVDDEVGADNPSSRRVARHDVRAGSVGHEGEGGSGGRGVVGGSEHVGVNDGTVDNVVGENGLDLSRVELTDGRHDSLDSGIVGREHGDASRRGQGSEKTSLLDQTGQAGEEAGSELGDGGREGDDSVDDVDEEVGGGYGLANGDVRSDSLEDLESGSVGRVPAENEGSGPVSGKSVVSAAENSSSDGVVGHYLGTVDGDGGVDDVVRQDLGEEIGVGRYVGRDGSKGIVVGGKDGLVTLGKRREESGTVGGVSDGRSNGYEGGETSAATCQSRQKG